jgi:Fe2+ transport system protein B
VSGWTTETLREHLTEKLADQRATLAQQIADLRESVRSQADDHRRMLDERYATQTKALDAAFKAAEQAVAVALSNAEKATQKAETAAERRFESVNEFRQSLSDQTQTFLPRQEYSVQHNSMAEQIQALATQMGAMDLRMTSRIDRLEASEEGVLTHQTQSRAATSITFQLIMAILVGLSTVLGGVALALSLKP